MKTCLTCDLLGMCATATEEMVRDNRGCGSWKQAMQEVINARRKARELAGAQAIREMLKIPSDKLVE